MPKYVIRERPAGPYNIDPLGMYKDKATLEAASPSEVAELYAKSIGGSRANQIMVETWPDYWFLWFQSYDKDGKHVGNPFHVREP